MLTQPYCAMSLECGPQNVNAGNLFVLQQILVSLCEALSLS